MHVPAAITIYARKIADSNVCVNWTCPLYGRCPLLGVSAIGDQENHHLPSCETPPVVYISGSFTITSHSPEEGHPSPKVLGKYCFSQKLLTGELSTAHGYPHTSPTKRDNTPFKKTARSEAVVAEVPAGRSGRERRHTPLRGVAPFRGSAIFLLLHCNFLTES